MNDNPNDFSRKIRAGYSDTFSGRELRPTSMMACLEETAAEHCRFIGRDLFSLLEEGEGWVLTGDGMQMFRYPEYGEEFRIRTWISDWKVFSGIREYQILGSDGSLIGEAGGRWVYWNMSTRRPMPVPEVFRRLWSRRSESPYRRLFPDSRVPVSPDDYSGIESRVHLEVRRGDVDLYGHLHNTTYMDWLLESVPAELWSGWTPSDMRLRFFGEALLGDSVVFTTRQGGGCWIHEVHREKDGRLLVRGATRWVAKAVRMSA